MSCSLPQSEASGGAPLSRSRRLTEVGVTRGCLLGSSHLLHQFTHRHDELANSFFGGNDSFAGKAWRGPTLRKPERRASIASFLRRGGRLARLHRRGPVEVSCRALATTPRTGRQFIAWRRQPRNPDPTNDDPEPPSGAEVNKTGGCL